MEAADWASLSEAELLERRISSLGLRLEGTALEPLIRQLYDELSAKGLVFHPPCHVGDEWFVPVGIPAPGNPASPRPKENKSAALKLDQIR